MGRVSLVGAGPGDPALLTRRAANRLCAADLVLFDALVDERVLKLAPHAQRFFVGKRAGRHALTQDEISNVMIRAARRGRRVVRLKGGDPFVFGRGGEEALALQAAGVPFDVVPGVSSVLAGPALAGIPVTHRGTASAVLVTTGHDEAVFAAQVGQLSPKTVTLVVAMGHARRAAIAGVLRAAGWPAETPAAVVAGASWPRQHVWRGTIARLEQDEGGLDDDVPALLVVGQVAALDVTSAHALEGPQRREARRESGSQATERVAVRSAPVRRVRRGER
jgi:uroporphyrin-III C-methyltransferase/precorrin-2 dehydrogenase/sirohydrochlorin ferrochelatase